MAKQTTQNTTRKNAQENLNPAEFPDNVNPSPEAKQQLDKLRQEEQKEQENADRDAREADGQNETVNR